MKYVEEFLTPSECEEIVKRKNKTVDYSIDIFRNDETWENAMASSLMFWFFWNVMENESSEAWESAKKCEKYSKDLVKIAERLIKEYKKAEIVAKPLFKKLLKHSSKTPW